MRKTLMSLGFIVIAWIFVDLVFDIPNYLFPSIKDIYEVFRISYSQYLNNSLFTIIEIIIGFLLANLLGIIIAILALNNKYLERLITTISIIIKTIPIIAIAPLLVLWFGHGMCSKYAAVVITCFSPILINTLMSSKIEMQRYKQLIDIYNLNRAQALKHIIFPGIVPSLISSLKISSSLAVVGALVSEFICANKGLGYLIISNYNSMNIAGVFICIIISSIIGITIFELCNVIEDKVKILY